MVETKHVIPVFVPHLGCPNECVFCNQHAISGSVKPAGADEVHRAVSEAMTKTPPGLQMQLAFYGGSFTAIDREKQNELISAAYGYVKSGYLSGIRVSTRPDAISREVLEFLRGYGVDTIELGAQSMVSEVLSLSRRGHTPEDTIRAAQMVKDSGFGLVLQMMTALPGDTWERSVYTARELIRLRPGAVRIYPAVVIKGTVLYSLWQAGSYRASNAEEAAELCARIFVLFRDAGIPVIRMGLDNSGDLSGGNAVAGAFHPAFGELVYSKVMLEAARELLSSRETRGTVTLCVNKSCVSQMTGHKRRNIDTLKSEFLLENIKIIQGSVGKWDVKLE